jgi:hypothetical protein
VVWDSGLDRLTDQTHRSRPRGWTSRSHAGTAVTRFLFEQDQVGARSDSKFIVSNEITEALAISSVKNGLLYKIL